ncbi:hypothetical protein [Halorubellus salinus]|uniref:hypothetical protein n=1 Tax=Halorubellus salinus TaxID=755309 RepID=UPI001D09077A|nr:hypothetical protein [Halorubellus salinus]
MRSVREWTRGELAALLVATLAVVATVGVIAAGPGSGSPVGTAIATGDSMGHDGKQAYLYIDVEPSVGDPIVFETGDTYLYHRIVDETSEGWITKGDANPRTDQAAMIAEPVGAADVVGVPVFSVQIDTLRTVGIVSLGAVMASLVAVLSLFRGMGTRLFRSSGALNVSLAVLVVLSTVGGLVVMPAAGMGSDSIDRQQTNASDVTSAKEQFSELDVLSALESGGYNWLNFSGGTATSEDTVSSGSGLESVGAADGKALVPDNYFSTAVVNQINISTGNQVDSKDLSGTFSSVASVTSNPSDDSYIIVGGNGVVGKVWSDNLSVAWSVDKGIGGPYADSIRASENYIAVGTVDNFYLFNKSTRDIEWKAYGTDDDKAPGNTRIYEDENAVYWIQQNANVVKKFNLSTGTEEWSAGGGDGSLDSSTPNAVASNGDLVAAPHTSGISFLDADTGSKVENESLSSQPRAVMFEDGYFWAGDVDGDVLRYSSDGTTKQSFSVQSEDVSYLTRIETSAGSKGGNEFSGVVKTTEGAPCANCTVRVAGVDHSQITLQNAASLEERADNLLEQARNAKPPQWDSDVSLTGSGGLFGDVSSEYPAVHSKADWGLEKWEDTTSLGDPLVEVPANQPVVLSSWDPTKSSLIESEVNADLRGKTTDSPIQLTHLDPAGDGLKTETIPLSQEYQVGVVATSTHSYATVELSPGFYEVSVKNSSVSYTIVAGDPNEIAAEISKKLLNREDELRKHAKQMRERFNSSKFVAETVVTSENGSFSVSLPSNVQTVSATAYKVPAGMDPSNATRADIREYYNTMNISRATVDVEEEEPFVVSHHDLTRADANLTSEADLDDVVPAFYLPAGEVREDVPASNVTLEVYKTDIPKYADPGITANRSQLRDWFLSNLTYGDLPPALQDRWNATRERLNETREKLKNITAANEELRSWFEKLLAEQRNTTVEKVRVQIRDADKTKEELREEVGALRQAIAELESTVSIDEPEVSAQSDNVSLAWTLPGALDSANVSVLAHYANGTTRSVPSKYVAVDEGTLPGQGDVVRVSEFPLGDSDPASVQFELMAASSEGWATSSEVVKNPSFSGELPSIDSISLSTVNPGPKENVTVRVSPSERGSWKQITNVSVLGPDGSTIGTGPVENGSSFAFTTAGAGVHTAQITAETTGGSTVEIPVRIKAVGREVDAPPTLSVKESPVGEYVLTSAEFERAEVSTENARERVQVTAQLPNGDGVPSEVSVHLEELSTPGDSTVSVKFVRGENEESVTQHVPVTVHMAAPSGNLLLWRNGQAVSNDGGSWGQANIQSDQLVIKTFTDDTGDLTLQKQNDAGLLAQISHGFAQFIQGFSLSVSFAPTVPVPAPATTSGQAMLAGSADVATPAPDAVALEEVVA